MVSKDRMKVLVCPLDWGLGHASRCVPVIRKLLDNNAEVIIGADKLPKAFLQNEFPELKHIDFPSCSVSYPSDGAMVLKMLLSAPKILKGIFSEHRLLKKIIRENDIDIVISDNRFGLWNRSVYSVFITHQLMIKCPSYLKFLEPVLKTINYAFINKYDECWVPDFAGDDNLSGDLSHKYALPAKVVFIEPLSRFGQINKTVKVNIDDKHLKIDLLVILSGPEPQRTILEDKIISRLIKAKHIKAVILRGKTDSNEEKVLSENINVYSHLKTEDFYSLLNSSEIVLCRSGYSGIMDLASAGKKAVLVPTPGQTEQQYLAEYLMEKKLFYYQQQDDLDILKAIDASKDYKGIKINTDEKILDLRIAGMLNSVNSENRVK